MGQRRDAALREDALLSARTLKNFDLDYEGETADLQIRKGYDRWNTTELDDPATQLFAFVDQSQNFNLLGISSSRWKAINETGAHVTLVNEAATAKRPIESFGNRAFFATDSDAYWTDNASIGGVNPSYRLGIVKPNEPPGATNTTSVGYVAGTTHGLNAPTVPFHIDSGGGAARTKIAVRYTPTRNIDVDAIYVHFAWGTLIRTGMIRMSLFDDSAGDPGTLLSAGAQSDWIELSTYDDWVTEGNAYQYLAFEFPETTVLTSGVDYWFVVEPNETYLANYVNTSAVNRYMVAFRHETPVPAGWASRRYTGAGSWVADTRMLSFWLGGLDPSHFYDYKLTYVNNTYGSESRPSERSVRISPTVAGNRVRISGPSTSDPQVSTMRIYRRDIGTDNTVSEANITGQYFLVDTHGWLSYYEDGIPDHRVGARLHSEDHYLYDEGDDTNQNKRDAFTPAGFIEWKGRIWAWEENEKKLYFTKRFERNNPSGLVGESAPDYFPLDNTLDFPVPAGIINAKKLGNDQLAVYFRNEQIWIVSGMDSTLNPPSPTEVAIRPTYQTIGLFAPDAARPYGGANLYLGREGLYRFFGIGSQPELLSETQGNILADIENQYLLESKLVTYGREIWLLVDSDNDGALDLILILDLERDFPTRTIIDRAWKSYEYPAAINDIAVHSTGDVFREILAANSGDGWIHQLNNGDTDNGAAIAGTVESHHIRAPKNAMINMLELQGEYNDESAMPTIAVTVTSHAGDTFSATMTPTGNEDIRGQTVGLRMKRPVSVKAELVMTSTKRDRIRSIALSYEGE